MYFRLVGGLEHVVFPYNVVEFYVSIPIQRGAPKIAFSWFIIPISRLDLWGIYRTSSWDCKSTFTSLGGLNHRK